LRVGLDPLLDLDRLHLGRLSLLNRLLIRFILDDRLLLSLLGLDIVGGLRRLSGLSIGGCFRDNLLRVLIRNFLGRLGPEVDRESGRERRVFGAKERSEPTLRR